MEDPHDVLSTHSSQVPHNSAISSNIFLLKKEPFQPPVGNVTKIVSLEVTGEQSECVWWAVVDGAMATWKEDKADITVNGEAAIHLYGYLYAYGDAQSGVKQADDATTLAKLFLIPKNKAEELGGSEVGKIEETPIYAKLISEPTATEADGNAWIHALKSNFPDFGESKLVFYLFRLGVTVEIDIKLNTEKFLEDDFDLEKLPKVSRETGDLISEDNETADDEEVKQGPVAPEDAVVKQDLAIPEAAEVSVPEEVVLEGPASEADEVSAIPEEEVKQGPEVP